MSKIHENTPNNTTEPHVTFHEKRKWVIVRRISHFVGRALGIFVLVFLLFAFLIQMPPVQRWGIEKTTDFLSKELNTKVDIGDFRLDFFDEISIGNVYLSNQNAPSDTLLSVGRLRIDVNYLDLFWGIIQLDVVKLEETKVRLRRNVGQYDNNFQFIADYFAPPNKKKKPTASKATDIRFGQIHLRDLDFVSDDKVVGELIDVKLKAADIHTNIINLPHKIMDLTRVNVFQPYVHISETIGNPLLPRPKTNNSDETEKNAHQKAEDEKPFQFLIGAVSAENGVFKLDNWEGSKTVKRDSTIDFDHLAVSDINIAIHNFMFTKDEWTGVVDGISLKERSGFVLNKLTVGDAKVTPTETALYGLQIETPNTIVGDTFRMIYPTGYTAFLDYNNQVVMDGRIHTSKVLINDILYFTPPLKENPFFRKNRYANARLEAKVFGKVNSLKVNSFSIGLGDGFIADGSFSSHNLDNVDETYIDLDLKELRTNMTTLQQLIPNFKPDTRFNKFGQLGFAGTFVGFFNKFTATGRLETALGAAVMDMTLAPQSDTTQAFYSGSLALDKFNLRDFTELPDLGKITMKTEILRGVGFSNDKMSLELVALVDNFQYKNYDYHDLNLSGKLSHKQFNGQFESKDPNVDFKFDGFVDFASELPVYKFKSDIRQINFQKLNLMPEELGVSGQLNLDLSGDKLSNIAGTIDGHNLLIKDKRNTYPIDTLIVSSIPTLVDGIKNGRKTFTVNSEILTAQIDGLFALEKIPDAFKAQFTKHHPLLAKDLGLYLNPTPIVQNGQIVEPPHQDFAFNIFVKDTKNLTKLFDNDLDTLRNIKMSGTFDDANNEYLWKILTPETHRYKNIEIVEFGSTGAAKGIDLDWNISTTAVKIDGDKDFRQFTFQNHITADSIQLGLTSNSFSTALGLDTIELNAGLIRQDSSYKLSFGGTSTQSRLMIFGDFWDIDRENSILIDNEKLYISGFDMHNNDRTITIKSEGKRGMSAFLNNFDIGFLNKKLKDDRFVLGGKVRVYAEVVDIFKMETFGAKVMVDSLWVTGENRGVLRIDALGTNLKEPIHANISLLKKEASGDSSKVIADGFYYPSVFGKHLANSIDVHLGLTNYPFKTLQLLIPEGASGFKGRTDGSVHVEGPLTKINTEGSIRLRDAEIMIDYLKLLLKVKDETIKITNTVFDASGAKVQDKFGNSATIQGGLTHQRFQDFGLNVRATSKNFLFMNTTAEDNPLYYGVGIGEGDIRFTGDFDKTNILIKAKAGKGRDEKGKEVITRITFPFKSSQTASDARFIVFKNNNPTADTLSSATKPKVMDLNGVNLEMELALTPDAEANLIFDEVAGDNIKARGTGNFRINIDRDGGLGMNGEYKIERGDYLFTLFRLVNKNFAIKRGGTIRWTGTPFDATLNIDAEYKDLTTSPYNFVSEYVNTRDGTDAESHKPTKVGLTLKLTGEMLKPDINFNMTFPQLQGALKSYTESKLRILQQDPNELNKQAFGLIVVGSFLPSDIGVSQIRSGGINTLTETASNVVSNMLNKLVKEYVAGLDIQVGYNYYQVDLVDPTKPFAIGTGQQFRARSSYAINDRLAISGGVDVNQGEYVQTLSSNNSNVFVGGDFYLDYDFSEDRRLKLRLSYIRDQDIQGQRGKTAAGLRFQQEFDTVEGFFQSLKKRKRQNTDGTFRLNRKGDKKGK